MNDATPFRVATLSCPRCHTKLSFGEPQFCASCSGAWISEAMLHERVAVMQNALPRLEPRMDPRETIPCIACGDAMEPLRVHGIAIDRCRPHGFWFDRDELQAVLHASGRVLPSPSASPVPSSKPALAPSPTDGAVIAVDVATSAVAEGTLVLGGEVASGIGEGILDAIAGVLGGLFDLV